MQTKAYPALSERVAWHTLDNGLNVAVVQRKGFSRKIAYFVTDYGAIHTEFELDGKLYRTPAGVAHYLEHKLFDMPDRDVMAEFAAMGASPNAFTSYDMTAYYFSCTENFDDCLRLLLEFVSTPYFTEESVQKEQGIIGQEIDMNADSADTRIFENLMGAMYQNHPIRVPILGTRKTISQITPQTLNLCHKAFYRPENMLLCVVGDVDPQTVCSIASQTLPKTQPVTVRCKKSWQEHMSCPSAYAADSMEIAMPTFQLGFKCAPLTQGEEAVLAETVADLAAELLFGESSELYLQLYEQGLIDASFGGGFETTEGMAMLTCFGDSDDPEAIRDAILHQAKKLAEEGVSQEAFLAIKRSALGRRIRDLDSFDSVAFRTCAYYFSKFDYFRFPAIYRQVHLQQVLAFIKENVTAERASLSVIFPTRQEE